ncbi:hypothetical protein BJF83_14835 [Nocardiopsis sp. CNR-923]|uniref:hypothetical protein n=1 Tax=Nocardiopsis sp. CNR-923 TaxID=1904965 RepID=UPI000966EE58|nr:hypothetical protein [Nocardiopsis sp. CNR-923]OLT28649.1 hypothetical protein BJF83_14835 [Nocardiopsis sp. CNR-923]
MTDRTVPLRLKSAVRARSLAEEGVAVSMGVTAVVVRGARADTVWRALEPTLRAGFVRGDLTARFPAPGRPFLEGMLDQLEEHGFLREVEEETDLAETDRAAFAHLETMTRRPFAALRALQRSQIRVRASCSLLGSEVHRALERAGFRSVRTEEGRDGGAALTTRLLVPGHEEALHLIATGRGVWLSGPRTASASTELVERVQDWLRERAPERDRPPLAASAVGITGSLVAAQLALALVAHVARLADGPPSDPTGSGPGTAADPEFMVTSDDLVSEPHPFVCPPVLDPDRTAPLGPPEADDAAPEAPDLLEAVAHLWDRVFGPVGAPVPGDLPQLPVGLARVDRSDLVGCGFSTAQARVDALLGGLSATAWRRRPREGDGGLGLGLTSASAVGAAVADLVLNDRAVDWKDVEPPSLSAPARRLWAALTLRFGVPARLRVRVWEGLWLTAVLGPGDAVLGAGTAADLDACVREALLRAVAGAQTPHGRVVRAAARTDAATSSLTRWRRETGLVRVEEPHGAPDWRRRGVFAAVARWS